MHVKKILGFAIMAWGALGAYNQYTIYAAATAGTPSAVSMFNAYDPATLLSIPQGAGLLAAPMLADVGIAAVGAWLAFS
jgi:hypothetical protein